jgi:hypothetical protein
MPNQASSDQVMERLRSAIRSYQLGSITVQELTNQVFVDLGSFDRCDLVKEVVRILPRSAQGELRRQGNILLRGQATYVPSVFGRPPDLEAWRQRMRSKCQRLAILFRQELDARSPEAAPAGGGRVAVELRPELMPPALDEVRLAHLAELASRLDGAHPGLWEEDLAEFNRLAGTALPIEQFQGISGGELHEDWVRRVFYQQHIKPAAGVTRAELAEVVRRAMPTSEYAEQHEAYMAVFDANVPRKGASNLIFYPPDYDPKTNTWGRGRPIAEYDPTPEQIVEWAWTARR